MLVEYGQESATVKAERNSVETKVTSQIVESQTAMSKKSLLARALRIEWLGQTLASLCWIASVFIYGGDWLQLCAATAWLIANLAALATSEAD